MSSGSVLKRSKSWLQSIALAVSIASQVIVYFTLNRIDLTFHGELYNYIVRFSPAWADTFMTYIWIIYACLIIPIGLSTFALAISLIKTPKTILQGKQNTPIVHTVQATNEPPTKAAPTTNNQKVIDNPESDKTEQKTQPSKQVTIQTTTQPNIQKKTTTKQETIVNKNKDKIICPCCKKEFSTPLFMLDFSGPKPKLVGSCPFCNQTIVTKEENNT